MTLRIRIIIARRWRRKDYCFIARYHAENAQKWPYFPASPPQHKAREAGAAFVTVIDGSLFRDFHFMRVFA